MTTSEREQEAARCLRIAQGFADKGQHDQAGAWRDLARRTALDHLDKTHDYFLIG